MADYNDEFEVADNITMDVVKRRVNSWHRSQFGKSYRLVVKSENHIILKRKESNKIACYVLLAFIVLCIGSLARLSFPVGTTVEEIIAVLSVYGTIMTIIFVVLLGVYFLGAGKVDYSITFDYGPPISVQVHGVGAIAKSSHEIEALKAGLSKVQHRALDL